MNDRVVTPVQMRSIEKKNRIIEAGFELFSEKGYYNTNTAEIAKRAGVSTGIFYRYFTDKKDVYLDIFRTKTEGAYEMIIEQIGQLGTQDDVRGFLSQCIEYFVATHGTTKSVHEEFEAMAHFDEDVAALFQNIKESAMERIAELLIGLSFPSDHLHEKIHMIMDLIQSYCHEVAFGREECKDYDYLKDTVIETCLFLLKR